MNNKKIDNLKVLENKNYSIGKLNHFLDELINSNEDIKLKKADLLSYWLRDYTNYIKNECNFVPLKQENYKRGNVVRVNLGFNIGSEEGGLHYAIVVNNPSKSSNIVTIIPLTSKKENSTISKYEVSLGNAIINQIISKLEIISNELSGDYDKVKLSEKIEYKDIEIKKLNKKICELNKFKKEAKKIKNCDSIALVGNITTVSKQRISTPSVSNKFLKGISISAEQLDLIDCKIIELYTKGVK